MLGYVYILTSSQDGQLIIEADCSLKYALLIYALFTACVGIMTLTVCTILICGKFATRCCPLFVPRWSNMLMLDGLGIGRFGVSYNNVSKYFFGQNNGLKIIWVHISRLPVLHLDRD